MIAPTVKELARALIERLPDDATWDDDHQIYVRRAIEAGLEDSESEYVLPANLGQLYRDGLCSLLLVYPPSFCGLPAFSR